MLVQLCLELNVLKELLPDILVETLFWWSNETASPDFSERKNTDSDLHFLDTYFWAEVNQKVWEWSYCFISCFFDTELIKSRESVSREEYTYTLFRDASKAAAAEEN
jgi:hypothetical protein